MLQANRNSSKFKHVGSAQKGDTFTSPFGKGGEAEPTPERPKTPSSTSKVR